MAEVESLTRDSCFLALYGRLADRFGDNGLVSALIGRVVEETLELDLWVMSCRVFNREMELAMFDALVEQCRARRVNKILGVYIPSKKNGIVAGHYANLGFTRVEEISEGREFWHYDLPSAYSAKAHFIRRAETPKV